MITFIFAFALFFGLFLAFYGLISQFTRHFKYMPKYRVVRESDTYYVQKRIFMWFYHDLTPVGELSTAGYRFNTKDLERAIEFCDDLSEGKYDKVIYKA